MAKLRLYTNPVEPRTATKPIGLAAAEASAPFQLAAQAVGVSRELIEGYQDYQVLAKTQEETQRGNEILAGFDTTIEGEFGQIEQTETEDGTITWNYQGESYKSRDEAEDAAFNTAGTQLQDQVVGIETPEIREALQGEIGARVRERYIANAQARRERQRIELVQRAGETYVREVQQGNYIGAELALTRNVNSGAIETKEANAIRGIGEDAAVSVAMDEWRRAMELGGSELAAQVELKWSEDPTVPPDIRDAAVKQMGKVRKREEKAIEARDESLVAALEKEQARAVSDLEIAVSRGEASYSHIEAAFDGGLLTAAERTRLTKSADKRNEDLVLAAQAHQDVAFAVDMGLTLDPFNTDYEDAVDQSFRTDVAAGEDVINSAIRYAKTGILPETISNALSAGVGSLDVDQMTQTGLMYRALKQQAPHSLRNLRDGDEAYWQSWSAGMEMFGDPAQAREFAVSNTIELPDNVREARASLYRDDSKSNQDTLDALINDNLDQFGFPWQAEFGDVEIDPSTGLRAEYDRAVQTFYMAHGNIEKAQRDAFDAMTRVWGVTTVDGSEKMMKFSPEKVYASEAPGVAGTEDWLTRQFKEDTKGLEGRPKLISDRDTLNTRGGSYHLVNAENGDIYYDADGNPLRWKPDSTAFMRAEAERLREKAEDVGKFRGRIGAMPFTVGIEPGPEDVGIYAGTGGSIPARLGRRQKVLERKAELLERKADAPRF